MHVTVTPLVMRGRPGWKVADHTGFALIDGLTGATHWEAPTPSLPLRSIGLAVSEFCRLDRMVYDGENAQRIRWLLTG